MIEDIEPKETFKLSNQQVIRMYTLAEYMRNRADDYGIDGGVSFALGWVLELGYLYDKDDNSGVYQLFKDLGVPSRSKLEIILKYQKKDPQKIVNDHTLNKFYPEQILMYEAKCVVDEEGRVVGYAKHLEEISDKYGSNSKEYKYLKRTWNYINKYWNKEGIEPVNE